MKDYLLKAVACDEHVRIYICSSTALVEEATYCASICGRPHRPHWDGR